MSDKLDKANKENKEFRELLKDSIAQNLPLINELTTANKRIAEYENLIKQVLFWLNESQTPIEFARYKVKVNEALRALEVEE